MINVNYDELKKLSKGFSGYEKKLMTVINQYGESKSKSLANEARSKAKWQNQTGKARQSITGTYIKSGTLGTIRLEGFAKKPDYKGDKWGVDYFQHLEFHKGKKYAILRPTADKELPRITKVLANRLGKVKILGG